MTPDLVLRLGRRRDELGRNRKKRHRSEIHGRTGYTVFGSYRLDVIRPAMHSADLHCRSQSFCPARLPSSAARRCPSSMPNRSRDGPSNNTQFTTNLDVVSALGGSGGSRTRVLRQI
jgi:hypothetical protein